ncbi:glycosyltransferase [Paenibacillus sp. HJL G12]|uniref:Glycosyltransferase n=1 Tax=Paenibacillus dendrobii TaxID=2691084 RepID=A0A7X3IPQ1_9BACL|nr:glycosyltransferase [Paenibacillus dendrobii]MWV47161.1 glycosyltransferase [Paenibacillus dendrobii]
MSISVCILAKNEEMHILECLKSVKDIATEIIVINNNSTDNTKEIALDFGCKVIDSPHTVLDEGRNLYLEAATSKWIFIIDADERLDDFTRNEIHKSINEAEKNERILALTLDSYQYIGKGRWATIKLIRMVRNGENIRYQDTPIHSDLETSVLENNGEIAHCKAFVHHIDILINNRTKFKRERYKNHIIEMLRNEKITSITGGYLTCFLGLEYAAMNQFNVAESLYIQVINDNKEIRDFAKIFLAQNYIMQQKFKEAERTITTLENANNTIDYQITPILTEIHRSKGELDIAINLINNSIEKEPHLAHNYLNLSILYQDINPLKSIEAIEDASRINNYVTNPIINKIGESPNIFHQQTCIIDSKFTTVEIMEKCCRKLDCFERFSHLFSEDRGWINVI